MRTLLISILVFLSYCQNSNLYYSFEEGNYKVLNAFAIKDISCGTSHTVTQFLLGNSNKNDVDACVDAISAIACEKWNVPNPTPRECFGVSTKNK